MTANAFLLLAIAELCKSTASPFYLLFYDLVVGRHGFPNSSLFAARFWCTYSVNISRYGGYCQLYMLCHSSECYSHYAAFHLWVLPKTFGLSCLKNGSTFHWIVPFLGWKLRRAKNVFEVISKWSHCGYSLRHFVLWILQNIWRKWDFKVFCCCFLFLVMEYFQWSWSRTLQFIH